MRARIAAAGILAGLLVAPGSVHARKARKVRVPRALVGKVFCTPTPPVDQSPAKLVKHFRGKRPKVALKRGKDGHWRCLMVAFFRRRAVPGPITFWYYDKDDKEAMKAREPVSAESVDATPTRVFVRQLDIDPDIGFNKNHTYLLWVGQIIKNRQRVYARGTLALEP